ncbi:MAG: acyl carrier protein [Cyanobacteria bacterium RYN_339]|nr:acyl carrier protein [Cyanobacteria bacterium RYN_339]
MSIQAQVTAIVAEVLEADAATLSPTAGLVQELGMDSVLAIDIATAIEKAFKIKVPDQRLEEFATVGAIVAIVEELQVAGRA